MESLPKDVGPFSSQCLQLRGFTQECEFLSCDSYQCPNELVRTVTLARKMSNNRGVIGKTNNIYEEILMRQVMLI